MSIDNGKSDLVPRRLGMGHLIFFAVAASAPLTVLGGGITTTYAVTGNLGVPLAFLLVAATLAVFAVGYGAMSRYVTNAGAFYSYISRGLGRAGGVSGSFVALTAYNAIQICLYGLFGSVLGAFMLDKFDVDAPWWAWGLGAWALVAVLGLLRVDLNAIVLGVLLVAECAVVIVFDVVGFGNAADGVSAAGLLPGDLLTAGVGAVFAFVIAAFTGFESAAIYGEEARDPRRTVARATYAAVAFTGLFYALSAWALSTLTGPDAVAPAAAEAGPGLIFGALAQHVSTTVADIANVLLITSIFAALLSFHNGVARYLFALGRERVLPVSLSRVSTRTGAPVVGSVAQSALALAVVALFAMTDRDPVLDLFTWLSGLAAVGIVLLMTLTSASVVGFFRRGGDGESPWQRMIAPSLATVLLTAVGVTLVWNFDALLAPTNPQYLRWLLPLLVGVAAVAGLVWGLLLRRNRPDVYARIGAGNAPPPREQAPAAQPAVTA